MAMISKNMRTEKWAGLGGGGVTSSPANPEVSGSSPTWVVSLLPRAWVFVRPDLYEWQRGWCEMTLAVEAP
jgi:hypothetical protein